MADDSSDEVPGGGPYSPGPNKYTDGGTTVDDVAPVEGRTDGEGDEGKEKRDSVSRQLPS